VPTHEGCVLRQIENVSHQARVINACSYFPWATLSVLPTVLEIVLTVAVHTESQTCIVVERTGWNLAETSPRRDSHVRVHIVWYLSLHCVELQFTEMTNQRDYRFQCVNVLVRDVREPSVSGFAAVVKDCKTTCRTAARSVSIIIHWTSWSL
jgi:hypothetical protein